MLRTMILTASLFISEVATFHLWKRNWHLRNCIGGGRFRVEKKRWKKWNLSLTTLNCHHYNKCSSSTTRVRLFHVPKFQLNVIGKARLRNSHLVTILGIMVHDGDLRNEYFHKINAFFMIFDMHTRGFIHVISLQSNPHKIRSLSW